MTNKQKKRLEDGLFWIDAEPPKPELWPILKDALVVICFLLAVLFIYQLTQNIDAEHRLEDQKRVAKLLLQMQTHTTQKYAGMLANVMNGGTLIDHNTGTAYFFDKPAEIHLGSK